MKIDIAYLNKTPYKFLHKTKFFKEEISNFHFVSRILLKKENNKLRELAYISKGIINGKRTIKINTYENDIQIVDQDFANGTQFEKNFNELITLIKNHYGPESFLLFDVNETPLQFEQFTGFIKNKTQDLKYITYNEYIAEQNGQQATINFTQKINIVLPTTEPVFEPKIETQTQPLTLDLFSFSEEKNTTVTSFIENTISSDKQDYNFEPNKPNEVASFNVAKKFNDNLNALLVLKSILSEQRSAKSFEKPILRKYVGFGGLKEISFDPDNENQWNPSTTRYKEVVRKIISITTEIDTLTKKTNSLQTIRAGILNAHYTSAEIINAIYSGILQIGVQNANILEPSGGIGNFIENMPNQLRQNARIKLIEIDPITAQIAKQLHQDAEVLNIGYEESNITPQSQDVIISNVPFGNVPVFDPQFDSNNSFLTKRIHNYFFAKALYHAKEDGIIAFVTSKGLLDSRSNQNVREYIAQNADFLGALRLNNTAFLKNANTRVVADIIFLRKNTSKNKKVQEFINSVPIIINDKNNKEQKVFINEYFANNKEYVLGTVVPGGLYSDTDYTVIPNKSANNLTHLINKMLKPYENTYINNAITEDEVNNQNKRNQLGDSIKEGNIIQVKGIVYRKEDNQMKEVNLPKYVDKYTVADYIKLRYNLMNLINAEYNNEDNDYIERLRIHTKKLYQNSGLHANATKEARKQWTKLTETDRDGITVMSLTKKDGSPADILNNRTITPYAITNIAATIEEAIIISLQLHAKIEINTIKQLLNKDEDEILELSKGFLYKDPKDNYYTKDEYLSGNVKAKLNDAQLSLKQGNNRMAQYIDDLELIIPRDIPIHEIEVRMGSRWVPSAIYQTFATELLKDNTIKLDYYDSIDTYTIQGNSSTVEAYEIYGTKRRNALKIIIDALHIKPPVIMDKDYNDKFVVNREETEKANEKYEKIREHFIEWIYKDEDRRTLLQKIYNDKFNNSVKAGNDGSHLVTPGLNNIKLNAHQKDGIWMIMKNNGGIIDHIVGAGKTYIMIVAAMELKRTNVAQKPLIIGLKSTIPQIVESFRALYPLGNILTPNENDFRKGNRELFLSKIATGNYDAIIMSHEQFGQIPHENSLKEDILQEELDEIEQQRANITSKRDAIAFEKRMKDLELKILHLQNTAKDNVMTFQKMGIDHIMVDESQQYKNLAYVTKQNNVAGLSQPKGSGRAFNLLMAARSLQKKYNGDKGITFLSGTPISNSIVEMYSILKYLRPNILEQKGLKTFDQWASTFASPNTEIEYSVTGEFKNKTRFREFINLPELAQLYNEIADVRNDNNLILDKPNMKGGEYQASIVPISNDQKEYALRLIQFAKTKDSSIIGRSLNERQLQAYMLIVTTAAAKMSIDMRLIDKNYSYNPTGKIAALTDNCLKIYQDTSEQKGTQLIFCDLGTPKNNKTFGVVLLNYMQDTLNIDEDTLESVFGKYESENFRHKTKDKIINSLKEIIELTDNEIEEMMTEAQSSLADFNLYDEIKYRLALKGINEDEIAFVHSYNSKAQKEQLYEDVNNGKIRILLGSTQKLGTGVNVQYRLAAIHHVDAPWNPAGMAQRDGRGLRQGNWLAKNHLNNEIQVIPYATMNTLDTYKYQLLKTKNTFILQIRSSAITERTMKESSLDGAESFAMIMAELTGNNSILQKFKLEAQREKLLRAERNHNGMYYEAQNNIVKIEQQINQITENISKTTIDIDFFNQNNNYLVELIENIDGEQIERKRLKIDNINNNTIKALDDKPIQNIDYAKKILEIVDNKLNLNIHKPELEYKPLLSFNNINLLGKNVEVNLSNNGIFNTSWQYFIAIEGPSGNNYNLNYTTIPGVLLNNLTTTFPGINETVKKQENLLEKKENDLKSYLEIMATNGEFPKKSELNEIIQKIKIIDLELKSKDDIIEPTINETQIIIDNTYYPLHSKDIDISIVQGINSNNDIESYLVQINIELEYDTIWKKQIEPQFKTLNGQWNTKHSSIQFNDYNQTETFIEYMKITHNLESNIEQLISDKETVNEQLSLFLYNKNDTVNDTYLAETPIYLENKNTVSVKSLFNEHNYINFYSGNTEIKNSNDVAFIMSSLQNKAVEHLYAIHIDNIGKHHIQFISIGTSTGTLTNDRAIVNAALKLKTEKIYLIHNHPSGKLDASTADLQMTKKLNDQLKYLKIELLHLIINTYKKEYTLLEIDKYNTISETKNIAIPQYQKKIHNTAFINDEVNYITQPLSNKITEANDVFNFIQNLRFSAQTKYGLLILNNENKVIANHILPKFTAKNIIQKMYDTGIGASIILYSNSNPNDMENELIKLKNVLKLFSVSILDTIYTTSEDNKSIIEYYSQENNSSKKIILKDELLSYGTGKEKFDGYVTIENKHKWDKMRLYSEINNKKLKTKITNKTIEIIKKQTEVNKISKFKK